MLICSNWTDDIRTAGADLPSRALTSTYLAPYDLQFTMTTSIARNMPFRPSRRALPIGRPHICRQSSTQSQNWAGRPFDVAKDNVAQLAASPRRPLTLADLLKSV